VTGELNNQPTATVVALCQKKFDAPNYLKLSMIWWKETLLSLLTSTVH